MYENEQTRMTRLSPWTIVLLIGLTPSIALVALMILSYHFTAWK